MDPELLPGSVSRIKVPDPDPVKVKEHINKTVNSVSVCTIGQYGSIE